MKIEQAKKVASASRRMILSGGRAGKYQVVIEALLAFDLEHEKRKNEDALHASDCERKTECCRRVPIVKAIPEGKA